MKSRLLTSLFATAALVAGSYATAYAQCPDFLCLPDGTVVTCQVDANGTKVWVDATGTTYSGVGSDGIGEFAVTQCACGNTDIQLSPTDLRINSDGGPLGQITTTLDRSVAQPTAYFRSHNLPNQFPASEDFSFIVEATASAFPGQIFKATRPLHFHSDEVQSFNPHREEHFRLVEPVEFIDAAGDVIFSLQEVTVRLN